MDPRRASPRITNLLDWHDQPVPKPQPDIVLFDLDGTLTDSALGMIEGFRLVFDHFGVEQPDEAAIRSNLGPPLAVTWREHYGFTDEQIAEALVVYRDYYHDEGMFVNEVFPGIPELLAELSASGVTLATSTSKPEYSATRILQHFGLDEHFTFIGAATLDGSRDAKALVIGHTLTNLQADASRHSIMMVGDRSHDVHGARENGIDTIGVLWGYGSAEELDEAGAVALAEDTEKLRSQILD